MSDYITIGEIIRHYRKEKGLSQEELSEGICDRKHLSHIENDKTIPTLDIINRLSQRLQINLYETYALMLRHRNIETHKKIEILNQNYKPENIERLLPLIKEFECLPDFQTGEPKQTLLYTKAVYYSYKLHDFDRSIRTALKGLSLNNEFTIENSCTNRFFSNVELSLLLCIMVDYCRMKNFTEGKKYYIFLYNYITNLFSVSHYATNRNEQFELRFLSKLVYNYFIFFKDDDFDVSHIDKTLKLMKSLHSHCMLPELLLCKAYIEIREGNVNNAKQTYSLAHQLGLYLYSESYQKHLEKTTLEEYFETLTEAF